MAYTIYKVKRDGGKYVYKKHMVEFLEIDALNTWNKVFVEALEQALKKSDLTKAMEKILWSFSIKTEKLPGKDLLPEYLEYVISDLFDYEEEKTKKLTDMLIEKRFNKVGNHFTRKGNMAYED